MFAWLKTSEHPKKDINNSFIIGDGFMTGNAIKINIRANVADRVPEFRLSSDTISEQTINLFKTDLVQALNLNSKDYAPSFFKTSSQVGVLLRPTKRKINWNTEAKRIEDIVQNFQLRGSSQIITVDDKTIASDSGESGPKNWATQVKPPATSISASSQAAADTPINCRPSSMDDLMKYFMNITIARSGSGPWQDERKQKPALRVALEFDQYQQKNDGTEERHQKEILAGLRKETGINFQFAEKILFNVLKLEAYCSAEQAEALRPFMDAIVRDQKLREAGSQLGNSNTFAKDARSKEAGDTGFRAGPG